MNYIIYTDEGYTETPSGRQIENCQILYFQYNTDISKQDVLEMYIKEQKPEKSGYDLSRLRIKAILN